MLPQAYLQLTNEHILNYDALFSQEIFIAFMIFKRATAFSFPSKHRKILLKLLLTSFFPLIWNSCNYGKQLLYLDLPRMLNKFYGQECYPPLLSSFYYIILIVLEALAEQDIALPNCHKARNARQNAVSMVSIQE